MRLALKLVLAFMLANIALAAIYGYLAVRREVRTYEHNASEEAEAIGPAMQVVLADAWRESGIQGVQECVRRTAITVQETRDASPLGVVRRSGRRSGRSRGAPEHSHRNSDRAPYNTGNRRFRRKSDSRYLLARSAWTIAIAEALSFLIR